MKKWDWQTLVDLIVKISFFNKFNNVIFTFLVVISFKKAATKWRNISTIAIKPHKYMPVPTEHDNQNFAVWMTCVYFSNTFTRGSHTTVWVRSLHGGCNILLPLTTIWQDHTVLEVEMINGGTIVVDDHKLVDAAELSDQRCIEVRLNPADEILGTRQCRLHGLSFYHKITITIKLHPTQHKHTTCINLSSQGQRSMSNMSVFIPNTETNRINHLVKLHQNLTFSSQARDNFLIYKNSSWDQRSRK